MAKRCRESDSDGAATAYSTVFIDTNLDTHLAMIVSDADTVSDLKQKVVLEHPRCFPKVGEIKIHALKVKRKGHFYHLSDSMLVKSAFERAKKNWFISIDASSIKQHGENQNSCKSNASNQLALLCIAYNSSGDRRNVSPDDPSTSVIHESALLQPLNTQCTNQKLANHDQSSPRDPYTEISKDMEMEVKHITNDHCKSMSSDSNRRSDFKIWEKYDAISEGTKVAGTTAEYEDDCSRDGISFVQCNHSVEQSQKTGPAAKKKRKTKKQDQDVVCDSALGDKPASNHVSGEDASHPEIVGPANSFVDAGREISNDMKMGNKDFNEKHCKTSISDTSKGSDSGSQVKYIKRDGTAIVPGIHVTCENDEFKKKTADVRCNNSFEEASHSGPAVKKKSKVESKEGRGNTMEENGVSFSNSNKETSKPDIIIPENSAEDKHRSRNAASDGLFSEPPDDDHLRSSSGSGRRKKRKKKGKYNLSSCHYDQVATIIPSSVQVVEEERNCKENVEINHKDLGKVSDVAIIVGHSIQPGKVSEPSGMSLKEKHSELEQEVVEGTDICEPDTGNEKGRSDALEFIVEGTKCLKKHHASNMEEIPPVIFKELHNLNNDIIHSTQKNLVRDDHKVETDQSRADVPIEEPALLANFLNAKGAMDSGNFCGSKRKKMWAKKSVAKNQDVSRMEPANNPVEYVSSLGPHSDFNDHLIADRKGDNRNGNEAECLPLVQMNRELLPNHDPEVMLSAKCKTLSQGDADVNMKEPILSAKKLDAEGTVNSPCSKRKLKRAKKSATKNQDLSGLKHADNDGSCISPIVTKSKQKSMDSSSIRADREGDNVSGNEAEWLPLTQKNRSQENAEHVDEDREGDSMRANEEELFPLTQMNRSHENVENVGVKSGKKVRKSRSSAVKCLSDFPIEEQGNKVETVKLNQVDKNQDAENMDNGVKKQTKKSQKSAAKSHPDLPIKEQEVGVEKLTASNDKLRDVDTPSKTTMKARLVKTSAVNQLAGSELVLENISEVPSSHKQENISKGRPEAKVDTDKHVEVSTGEGDEIDFKHYFVPGQDQNGIAPADKVKEATKSDWETKAKNTKKLVLPSVGTSPDLQTAHKSYEKKGGGKKSHIKNPSCIQPQDSLLKDVNDEVMLPSKKKSSEVSANGVKAPCSPDIDRIKTPQEARQPDVVSVRGTSRPALSYRKGNNQSLASSSSSSESSGRSRQIGRDNKRQSSLDLCRVTGRKASTKNTGEAVKSLLTTPGAIFRDGSSDSSADENGTINSDASTRTPSDNSSSSGFEGENEANLDSLRNGSYGVKGKEDGKNMKSLSSGPKNITMDMIFRSSSRFKKAKLTASQSQPEDTESQPVDFVPDSQANP